MHRSALLHKATPCTALVHHPALALISGIRCTSAGQLCQHACDARTVHATLVACFGHSCRAGRFVLQIDGRKRISPEAVGSTPAGSHNNTASAKNRPPLQPRPPKAPNGPPHGSSAAAAAAAGPSAAAGAGSKRKASDPAMPAPTRRRVTPDSLPGPSAQLPGSAHQAGPSPPGMPAASAHPAITFQQEPQLHAELGKESLPLGDQPEGGSRVLEAVLRGSQWELVCHSSGLHQWTDQVPAKVVAVACSLNFAAAAFETAVLQVSSMLHMQNFQANPQVLPCQKK